MNILTGNVVIKRIWQLLKKTLTPADLTNYSVAIDSPSDLDTKRIPLDELRIALMNSGLLDYRGDYDASVNLYPASGGSGTGGLILKSNIWIVTTGGTIDGNTVIAGQTLMAKVDNPGQTSVNWAISTGGGGGTSSFPGTGVRIVEASDGPGTLSATKTIVNAKLTDATAITRLTTTSNWDINGAYTGTAITGTFEGQYYRNDEYFFFAYADNDWIRMVRL